MSVNFPEHLMAIEFTITMPNGYEIAKVALFNETVVSEETVRSWIDQDTFSVALKPTVVIMSKQQYLNLYDRIEPDDKKDRVFYEDLAMEQKETM